MPRAGQLRLRRSSDVRRRRRDNSRARLLRSLVAIAGYSASILENPAWEKFVADHRLIGDNRRRPSRRIYERHFPDGSAPRKRSDLQQALFPGRRRASAGKLTLPLARSHIRSPSSPSRQIVSLAANSRRRRNVRYSIGPREQFRTAIYRYRFPSPRSLTILYFWQRDVKGCSMWFCDRCCQLSAMRSIIHLQIAKPIPIPLCLVE